MFPEIILAKGTQLRTVAVQAKLLLPNKLCAERTDRIRNSAARLDALVMQAYLPAETK